MTKNETPRVVVTEAVEWARKVAASKPPRYTDASRNAARYILDRTAAEAASRAREDALLKLIGDAYYVLTYVEKLTDDEATRAACLEVRMAIDAEVSDATRAALTPATGGDHED